MVLGIPEPEIRGVESGGRWDISDSSRDSPLWSPDGRELFYRNGDSVMVVRVDTKVKFDHGKPGTLFRGTYVPSSLNDRHPWDIQLDGKRFLMMKPPQATEDESAAEGPRKINIILNWFEELKDRLPVD